MNLPRPLRNRFLAAVLFVLAPLAARAQTPCALPNLVAGTNTDCAIQSGGVARTFDVELPTQLDRTQAKVVLDVHGLGSSAKEQQELSGISSLVESRQLVVIRPTGLERSFNAGPEDGKPGVMCCDPSRVNNVADVQFFKDALASVETALGLDARTFVAITGLSNGSAMTNRLVCDGDPRFKLFAGVSFPLAADLTGCTPAMGTVYVEFHGTSDDVVPFAGSAALGVRAADAAIMPLAELRGCNMKFTEARFSSNTTCRNFTGCAAGGLVQMCTVEDGEHVLYPSFDLSMTFPQLFDNLLQLALTLPPAPGTQVKPQP